MSTAEAVEPESLDPWMNTNFGVFVRGITSNHQPVYWDPIRGSKPHGSDVGETGGGKTVARIATLVQPYFWEPHDAGFHILCIDGKGAGDYRFLEEDPWKHNATLVMGADMHDAIQEAVNHIEYRARVMGENFVRVWRTPSGLKPSKDDFNQMGHYIAHPSYDGKEIMMKVEAFHMLTPEFREDLTDDVLKLQFLFVSADEVAEFTDEERGRSGDNSSERTKRFLRRGVSLGRFAGCYWLLGMQRPDVRFLGPQTRDQIGARMAFGQLDVAAWRMFTGQSAEDSKNGDQLLNWAIEQSAEAGYAMAIGFDKDDANRMIRVRHLYTDPKWLYPEAVYGSDGAVHPAATVDVPVQRVEDSEMFISSLRTTPKGLGREKEKEKKGKEWLEEEVEWEGKRGQWRLDEKNSRECNWVSYRMRQVKLMVGALRNSLRMPTPSKWRARERNEFRDDGFRDAVGETKGFKCACCGARGRLEADHKRPWSLGGTDDVSNGQMLCGPSTEDFTCHWWKTRGDMKALKNAKRVWFMLKGRGTNNG